MKLVGFHTPTAASLADALEEFSVAAPKPDNLHRNQFGGTIHSAHCNEALNKT